MVSMVPTLVHTQEEQVAPSVIELCGNIGTNVASFTHQSIIILLTGTEWMTQFAHKNPRITLSLLGLGVVGYFAYKRAQQRDEVVLHYYH